MRTGPSCAPTSAPDLAMSMEMSLINSMRSKCVRSLKLIQWEFAWDKILYNITSYDPNSIRENFHRACDSDNYRGVCVCMIAPPSISPYILWTSGRKAEVQPLTDRQWLKEKSMIDVVVRTGYLCTMVFYISCVLTG